MHSETGRGPTPINCRGSKDWMSSIFWAYIPLSHLKVTLLVDVCACWMSMSVSVCGPAPLGPAEGFHALNKALYETGDGAQCPT